MPEPSKAALSEGGQHAGVKLVDEGGQVEGRRCARVADAAWAIDGKCRRGAPSPHRHLPIRGPRPAVVRTGATSAQHGRGR